MEELSLEQIKKKSELEEDIDFEKGDFDFDLECHKIMVTLVICQVLMLKHVIFVSFIDLLKIPPGFRVGMDFSSKGTSCFLT